MRMCRRFLWPVLAALTVVTTTATAATGKPVHVSATTHLDSKRLGVKTAFGDTLYDQNATGNNFGAFVNDVIAPPPTLGNTSVGADDFVVSDAAGWTVTGFVFNAFGPNGVVPPANISLTVYSDDGSGAPGATIACSAPATTVTYDASTHQITAPLASACALPAGTYWVAWSFDDVDLSSGVWGWWGQTTTLHNQPAVWWNSGGNFGTPCTASWGTFAECGNYDPSLRDYGFAVLGHVTGSGSALQLSLGLAPYDGDPNECGAATELEVNVGDQVNICYTLTNNSADTLAFQSITDSVDGAILSFEPMTIGPGQSHNVVRTIVATGDTDRSATWTGYLNLASYAYDDTVTPNFVDISATGTDIGFTVGDNQDNEFAEFTADFPVRFYGRTSTALCISNDGIVVFDDPSCTSPGAGQNPDPGYSFNQDIPTTFGLNVYSYFAPMWGNLGDGPGHVYTQTLGTAPNRTFIVQWNDLATYAIATTTATFQLVLQENSDTIRYEYLTTAFGNDADNGAWFTVGLQGDPNGLYTKYSYYQPSLSPNSAIQWSYTASVSSSTDSDSVRISAGDPTLSVAQASITAVVGAGATATRTLSIANTGNRDLHWDLGEAPGGPTAHFPKTPRYVSPSLLGANAPAPGASFASATGKRPQGGAVSPRAIAGSFAVPAFAISALKPGLVTFDALNPLSTYTSINDSSDWIYAASFIGNDFSKLYVIINDSWESPPGTYGTIDVTTGVFTSLGMITGGATSTWAGLTQDPLTGTVYVINFLDAPGTAGATLYTLNLQTGQATRIGAIDGPGVNPVHYISGITVSPAGLMYGLDLYGQSLIAIDKTSGAASVIESLGLNVQYVQDIKFDVQTGDLYWAALYIDSNTNQPVGEMRVIDPLTAASQAIGAFPPAGEYPIDEMSALAIAKPAVGCSAPGDVPWLSFSPTSGTIVADAAAQDVSVTLDSTGLSPGLHQATICVFSDDPRHQAIAVQVAFAVTAGEPLYDQSITDTSLLAFNNTIVAPAETEGLSAEGADDFVVTENGWSVSGFQFTAYGNNGNPMPAQVNLRILADDGNGRPAANAICSASNLPAIVLDTPANQIGVWLPAACELAPGTYWVSWSFANVNIASPILGFWGATTEQHNQLAVWRNPGGMLGTGCADWSTFDQCPAMFDATAKDFGFSVFGTASDVNCADVIFSDGFDGGSGACASRQAVRD